MKTLALALMLAAAPAFCNDSNNDDAQEEQYNDRKIYQTQREDQFGPASGLDRRQQEREDTAELQRRNAVIERRNDPMDEAMKKYRHYGSDEE